ncbi:glycosyl hydrolase family 28-related protein [Terriglobus sp. TAA 43]|uniref:glycosyl hydrolase family 28-related protein n=1 Tax=Terriglobus sp. TAA 43 TaxID=278961 RepID=UPI0006459839|nr:glycosyl hydrolase family 28-related protein [Terriglobus sp. TAA 43]
MCVLLLLLLSIVTATSQAQSVYLTKPVDALAVTASDLRGDGVADDTAALQAAIDRVADTTGSGIVFLPQGRYRITKTVYLWSGVRIFGYGAQRPVMVLAPNTPGFQSGHDFLGTGRYMLQFAANKPAAGAAIMDANEFTFYSGLSNIDFEIGAGNPAAIAVRFHVAQHSFLDHMHFSVGEGRAALEDVGNQAENLDIKGGEYGIVSVRTAPAWQFLLMDSRIHGQRRAAIHTQEVGMTLVRDEISDAPIAIETPRYMPEQLYAKDLLLKNISGTAFVLGDTTSQHNQVTLDNIFCDHVAALVADPVGGLKSAASPRSGDRYYIVASMTAGQQILGDGREGALTLTLSGKKRLTSAPRLPLSDIPTMPPVSEWINVRTLGAAGDGGTDDTAALQHAIDSHRVLYFPTGMYRLRGTLHTKPDTVLVGLNPATTVLMVQDSDANFIGAGAAVPLLETAPNGHEIVSGLGVFTGDIAPRAAGVVWRSGPRSLMHDVNFPAGLRARPVIAPKLMRSTVPIAQRPDMRASQYPSLWVRDGGGGLFRDVWTADTTARSGLLVEHTRTPSVAYQVSCEHHMQNEVQFHDAANWTVYALQTEEEKPNGADATALELINAKNITFANLFNYRVSRNVIPKLAATTAKGSDNIRFANVHVFSMTRLAFDNSLIDEDNDTRIRTHDFTSFQLRARATQSPMRPVRLPLFTSELKKLISGYRDLSGLTIDGQGTLYFADATLATVAQWDETTGTAKVLTKNVPEPMALAWPGSGDTLLAVDRDKAVYSVNTKTGATAKLTDGGLKQGVQLLIPVGFHNDIGSIQRMVAHQGFVYSGRSNMALVSATENEPRSYFYGLGTNTAVIAGGSWKGVQQSVQLKAFHVGDSALAVSEEDDKVYRVSLDALTHLTATTFIPRSGTSVVQDKDGNVYVAGAQLFVYDRAGKPLGTLEVPERPSSLAISGKTLYIGARSSLYSIALKSSTTN